MAYVFDLETSVPDFVDNLGAEIIEFALGYDVDDNKAIIMSVMLVSGASFLNDEYEDVYDLRFGIRERDLDHEWKVTAPDYTKECVKKYVPKSRRRAVFDRLLESLEVLAGADSYCDYRDWAPGGEQRSRRCPACGSTSAAYPRAETSA